MKLFVDRHAKVDIHQLLKERHGLRYVQYREIWSRASPGWIPPFPPHIDFELIDKCNQSCIMCARNTKLHQNIEYSINTKTVLDTKLFKKIILEGKTKGLFSLNFGAFAEPLVHPQCLELVKFGHDNGIVDSRIITNALLLAKYIPEIFNSGLTQLYISLDANTETTYQKIRGKGFSKVLENITQFLGEKTKRNSFLPIVRVSFVDMEENRHEKNEFLEFWKDKVDFVDIQTYQNENIKIGSNISTAKKFDCDSPFGRISVLSNGDVIPCCAFYGRSLVIGNASHETIESIWCGKKMQNIRSNLLNGRITICETCQRA